jgi:hypothetical protein
MVVESQDNLTEIPALLMVILRVTAFAASQESFPGCDASMVQILPLPVTPATLLTANAVAVGVISQIVGVSDFTTGASFEVATIVTGVGAPISELVGALIEIVCATFAPGSGWNIPVMLRDVVAEDESQ